jgi:hypothetical protein
VDRVHKLWTAQGWPVHGSTVDLTVAGGRSSPELGLAAVSEHDGLPWRQRRQEGGHGNPSGGLTLGGEAARRASGGGERSSMMVIGVEQLGVRIGGKERSSERSVERQRRGAFYRAGRRWRGGEEAGSGGVLIPVSFK